METIITKQPPDEMQIFYQTGKMPLSLTSEEVDEAMRQNARIPRSSMALAELLARHGVIQSHAIDDAEDYDGGATLDRIYAAHAEMISDNDKIHGSNADESEDGPVTEKEVTHGRDKIFDRDIEYVRADAVREALEGHRCSELFGDAGLIAATMRALNESPACSPNSEIRRLRALFPEILKNLKSGDCVAECSLEFLEMIPNEVKLVTTRLKRERDEARAMPRRIIYEVSIGAYTPMQANEWLKSHPEHETIPDAGANEKQMNNSEHTLDCICAWCEVERQHAEQRAAKEQAYTRRSAAACSEIPWTPRVKKMLMLSRKVAMHYRQNYVGSEHLLAGILAEKEGSAARMLEHHGITMDLLVKEYGWQTHADDAEENERAEYERLRAKFDSQNAIGEARADNAASPHQKGN